MTVVDQDTRPGLRSRSFRLLLVGSFVGFGGYAGLLPVVPLWADSGGSGELAAGATTGVFMAATVLTQFVVPWLLHRVGYRPVLLGGSVLLGVPTALYALSTDLAALLAVSTVRGVGFGLVTVAGSALIAELVPAHEHGRASARFGIAVGLPHLLLIPAGVGIVTTVGFTGVFVAAAVLPLIAATVLSLIAMPGRPARDTSTPRLARPSAAVLIGFTAPFLAMVACAVAQGGLITFLPLAFPDARVAVPVALLATTGGTLLGRFGAGEMADRLGASGWLTSIGVGVAAVGMLAVATSGVVAVVVGAALVGIGFGVVQNDAMVSMFAVAGAGAYGTASAAWNISYDTGTGIGAVALGGVAQGYGFAAAFTTSAVLLGLVLPAALIGRVRRAST